MNNYWYVAGYTEIMVDIDRPIASAAHAEARLLGAIECNKLPIHSVEIHTSNSETHLHCLITLSEPVAAIERAVWGIMFHSDIYRGCATIMRYLYNVRSADILITPVQFNRSPDAICTCSVKHDASTMNVCPAAIALRGEDRVRGFFGIPSQHNGRIFQSYYDTAHARRTNFTWYPNDSHRNRRGPL